MAGTHPTVWGIRAGEWHFDANGLFTRKNHVGLGWKDAGNLLNIPATQDAIKAHLEATHRKYPEVKSRQIALGAGALYRFVHVAVVGDVVVYSCKDEGAIYIGKLSSPYSFDSSMHEEAQHLRKVKWETVKSRAAFTESALRKVSVRGQYFWQIQDPEEFLRQL